MKRKRFWQKKFTLVKKGNEKKLDLPKSDERQREQPHTMVDESINEGMREVPKEKDVNISKEEAKKDKEAKLQRLQENIEAILEKIEEKENELKELDVLEIKLLCTFRGGKDCRRWRK